MIYLVPALIAAALFWLQAMYRDSDEGVHALLHSKYGYDVEVLSPGCELGGPDGAFSGEIQDCIGAIYVNGNQHELRVKANPEEKYRIYVKLSDEHMDYILPGHSYLLLGGETILVEYENRRTELVFDTRSNKWG